jgi:hypothetical protein
MNVENTSSMNSQSNFVNYEKSLPNTALSNDLSNQASQNHYYTS